MKNEAQLKIEDLTRQVEDLTHERDQLAEAIANATEALGHEGCAAVDLADSVGILQRLIDGKDVDCGLPYSGIAAQVEALVWLAQHAGSNGDKTKQFISRLPFMQGRR